MLPERIKELRKKLRLSQTEFGKKVGVSIDVIKNLEYGRSTPNKVLLSHICDVYGVNKLWLETGEGEMLEAKSSESIAIENALRCVEDSPALRSFFAAWSRLNPQNRAVLEKFVEDYVADYQERLTAEAFARDRALLDEILPEDDSCDPLAEAK